MTAAAKKRLEQALTISDAQRMAQRLLAPVALALVTIAGCPRKPIEAPEDDHTATCQAYCATVHACASDPVNGTEAECVADCSEPGENLWQSKSCDDLAEDLLRCLADMTCEQYATYEMDLASSVCHEETLDFSVCLSEEVD